MVASPRPSPDRAGDVPGYSARRCPPGGQVGSDSRVPPGVEQVNMLLCSWSLGIFDVSCTVVIVYMSVRVTCDCSSLIVD